MRALAAFVVLVIAGLAVFEVTMQPSPGERLQLFWIFTAVAALTGVGGAFLRRWMARKSLFVAVVALAFASVASVGVAAAVSAQLMFLTVHDLNVLFVVLGFGTGLGVVLAVTLAGPLARDLSRIEATAVRVAHGDLDARTGIERPDEVGAAAAALDGMVERLAAAEVERSRNEGARREFLAAVGHDLRSPLAALRATVEALEDGLAPDPERYLRAMRLDLDALGHLVDDLFYLATIEAGKLRIEMAPLDLAELADESIEAMNSVASRRKVRLRLDAAGAVTVLGGATALGRAIRNLVDNAVRHSPPGSEVIVRVTSDSGGEVAVLDEGPGFSGDLLDSVFESFVTGDPARARANGGAGLGLAIARGVVEAHGGSIWADAGPGGRVGFRLPARSGTPAW